MRRSLSLYIIITTLLCTSCAKWLDIKPETEVDKSQLFTTEDGFKEALLGIYIRGSKTDLYGKELTVGMPEVLAQNYTMATFDSHRYKATSQYKYDDQYFISRKDNIWKGLYNGIVNANLILENIDQQRRLFFENNYELIKGEALGLRAYLHFDILRLFAPSYIQNPNAKAIPYVTVYSNLSTQFATVATTIDSIVVDLEKAKVLLANDPIIKNSYRIGYPNQIDTLLNSETSNPDLFLQNRRHRMNYFAVCATLARVHLYKGDYAKALTNAKIVIDSKKFPWTNTTDFIAVDDKNKDRILYKEILFGWYIPLLNTELNTNWFSNGNSGMYLEQIDAQSIYETSSIGATDLRYNHWFMTVSNGNNYLSEIVKYRRNPLSDNQSANLHFLMAPALKLSEVYLIAAESSYDSNPTQALQYLDEIRRNRGIGQPVLVSNKQEFIREILKELRKDTFAEGQLFYAYKRLHSPIAGLQGTTIQPDNKIFVLPLPDDEIIYGNQKD
ncbi:RagB/SusD family nutrient uptake outer membrane protein [Sphingobacterium bovistauri]|uniref:RagB/SusD family nutrient uptake outer membrane protein n=1 Tax=Sphingobacterium bovistauri TaxID=2781959 RepID=A0ABS7Z7Z8_9SPHI|nr:RagB/SusD family nutrient uptake outer membrane protein [Sphingobacterium bovistauri]MCA5006323.1 RagB/SusD family nutrient uptake outer membrane protein [Sphingobacterium bovistauri]